MAAVKKTSLLLFFILLTLSSEGIVVRVHQQNLDNVRYYIHDDGLRRISPKDLKLFHQNFTQAARYIFNRFNEPLPPSFKVSLSTGSWIFQYQTGHDSHTAGLFHRSSGRFFFQNPAVLRDNNKLERTIYHQMMHCLIHRTLRGKDPHRLRWLEKSFCEALFPSYQSYASVSARDFRAFETFPDFKAWLRENLKATSPESRHRAFSMAGAYGKKLLQMTSERRILGILMDGRGALILEKAFLKLKEG